MPAPHKSTGTRTVRPLKLDTRTPPLSPSQINTIQAMTSDQLVARRTAIITRLAQIALPPPPKTNSHRKLPPSDQRVRIQSPAGTQTQKTDSTSHTDIHSHTIIPLPDAVRTTDTHWDYVLKELQWLATDFTAERLRHVNASRKLGRQVVAHRAQADHRRQRALVDAHTAQRLKTARIARSVHTWWHKLERVLAYQQKQSLQAQRNRAMNQQLVTLVRQTERYTAMLAQQQPSSSLDGSDDHDNNDIYQPTGNGTAGHWTIEEALQKATPARVRSVRDYTRVRIPANDAVLYGESTASDASGSDASFALDPGNCSDPDDETTLCEAELQELWERRQRRGNRNRHGPATDEDHNTATFVADADELRKLTEEADMDVRDVLERLRREGEADTTVSDEDHESPVTHSRQVQFAEPVRVDASPVRTSSSPAGAPPSPLPRSDPGADADDDADISDVEDFVDRGPDLVNDSEDDAEDEFQADAEEVDDETTLIQEEGLPQEMTARDELRMLQAENELSVEELRRKYAGVLDVDNERALLQDDSSVLLSSAQEEPEDHVEDDAEDDFYPAPGTDVDDETTLDVEERLGRDMSYQQEIDLLQNESEIPIEQLRARYATVHRPEALDETDTDVESKFSEASKEDEEVRSNSQTHMLLAQANEEGDAEEFAPDVNEVDDETTIEAEEKLGRDVSYADEIASLKRENEMSVDELRAMYAGMEGDEILLSQTTALSELHGDLEDDEEHDGDFQPDGPVFDDETTIEAEERLGREMEPEDEIALLKRESEVSVDELRAMYRSAEEGTIFEPEGNLSDGSQVRKRSDDVNFPVTKRSRPSTDESVSETGKTSLEKLEASAQRAQNTLATRPFLLSRWVKLRKYQQVGLNWLVSLQTRRLNGILADEMGLGKTLQTISLFSYLASYKGIWGPHLVVVPTSVIVNWETELKRFCPALKVLCYYGPAKRRKELRTGWTKSNWYHVVITSYQLAVQDAFAFKRKRWYYMVLDEAQNIKNFQSQRWQTLINFNTQRRLLLTGTPLQNNLMELWSLLHFLMPYIFRSRKEFSYWFANPMNDMIEGSGAKNNDVVSRLHGIIRPFVLRRLKKDVEKQMPGKFEHIVKCQLSRRQMLMYEEFMARSSTRMALQKGGNFMGMMNVLMQLRKVCNHPDLFEPRSIVTPFVLEPLSFQTASCVVSDIFTKSIFDEVSDRLRLPIWCGSQGEPSLDASLRHDAVESDELKAYAPPLFKDLSCGVVTDRFHDANISMGMSSLLSALDARKKKRKSQLKLFLSSLNATRCRSTMSPYSSQLIRYVSVEPRAIFSNACDFLSTPSKLLELRRSQQERAEDVNDLVTKFVFCVPKAGVCRPVLATSFDGRTLIPEQTLNTVLAEPLNEYSRPFRNAALRLSSFFPDKKLVQFDAGKLQTLAGLLRELKRGGHRCLVFTQMSKMLDILEAFLNLNGHTYLRLDGSTGVDRRQRLMDRFNNDPKLFCFILSTRSGGLGINLTGADSVIFYDSDWNPAMDAQAQDRAHRIGQTRDVHIYRLVTEHTIEENILVKAQQKRNLDILVMDKGKFDAAQLTGRQESAKVSEETNQLQDVYTKGGLRAVLGVTTEDGQNETPEGPTIEKEEDMSTEQMEVAMTSLEDADDVNALRGARKEAADDLLEFDESIELKKDSETEDDVTEGDSRKNMKVKGLEGENKEDCDEEKELEKEFASWQNEDGFDVSGVDASLTPTERYGLHFRQEIDPFYSIYAVMEHRGNIEAAEEAENEIDIDAIEREKAFEERRALADGDLLGTFPRPEDLIRQRNFYQREKARLRADQKRRKLTGENWERKTDGLSNQLFWYNQDTGEATWEQPNILLEQEAFMQAYHRKWAALPKGPLMHIMNFLAPYPDRMQCSGVCQHWRFAAHHPSFVKHVYPVEMGAYTREDRKIEANHFRTLADAVSSALPGDTIELGDGHYWIKGTVTVNVPIRIVGDEYNPANVVVEISGTIVWRGNGGWCEGVTFRRPKIASGEPRKDPIFQIKGNGKINVVQSVFDGNGTIEHVVTMDGLGSRGRWEHVQVKGRKPGNLFSEKDSLILSDVHIHCQ
jgi:SNF2 family DNA or RNA helicase